MPPATPTPGSVTKTVAPRTQSTLKPVKLGKAVSRFNPGVSTKVSRVSSAYVKAKYPGEVSGPSIIFTLSITNSSNRVVDLDTLVVNVLDAKLAPANRITSPPAVPMPKAVAAGHTVTGRYVFVVPKATRKPITIQVSRSADEPVVVFTGPVS